VYKYKYIIKTISCDTCVFDVPIDLVKVSSIYFEILNVIWYFLTF